MVYPGCARECSSRHSDSIWNAIYPHNATELSESDDLLPPNDMGADANAGDDGISYVSEGDGDTLVKGVGFGSSDELVGRVRIQDDGR